MLSPLLTLSSLPEGHGARDERLWRRRDEFAAALKTKLPHVMRMAESNFDLTLGSR